MVHASHPYKAVGNIKLLGPFFLQSYDLKGKALSQIITYRMIIIEPPNKKKRTPREGIASRRYRKGEQISPFDVARRCDQTTPPLGPGDNWGRRRTWSITHTL